MTDTAEQRSKPTPGPWKYGDRDDGNFRIYAPDCLGEQSGPVAEVMHRFDVDERLANARLIAAAPDIAAERDRLEAATVELVKALGEAEPWLMRLTSEVIDGEGIRSEYAAICAQVRAALAKAKESTP